MATALHDLATLFESGALLSNAERTSIANIIRQHAEAEPLSHRRARRDNIFRRLAADHFEHLSQRRQSTEIRKAVIRYQASGWQHDQHKVTNPRRPNTVEAALWDALTAYSRIPSDRQMRTILAS